jgi:hypothetical protein
MRRTDDLPIRQDRRRHGCFYAGLVKHFSGSLAVTEAELFAFLVAYKAIAQYHREVERWVLNWGTHATVLSPPDLATRVHSIATTPAQRYPNRVNQSPAQLPKSLQNRPKPLNTPPMTTGPNSLVKVARAGLDEVRGLLNKLLGPALEEAGAVLADSLRQFRLQKQIVVNGNDVRFQVTRAGILSAIHLGQAFVTGKIPVPEKRQTCRF